MRSGNIRFLAAARVVRNKTDHSNASFGRGSPKANKLLLLCELINVCLVVKNLADVRDAARLRLKANAIDALSVTVVRYRSFLDEGGWESVAFTARFLLVYVSNFGQAHPLFISGQNYLKRDEVVAGSVITLLVPI